MCILIVGPETDSQNLGMLASSRSCLWCSDNTERAAIPQVNILSAAQTTGRIMTGKECVGSGIDTQLPRQRDAMTQSCAALLRSASPPRVDTEEFVRIACHLLQNNYLHT